MNDAEVRERIEQLESALERASDLDRETVGMVIDLYGEALCRIVAAVDDVSMREKITSDELVAHLLLVHEPDRQPLEQRVIAALDEVRPYVEGHGGRVELAAILDGIAYVRLSGTCEHCSASVATLKIAVRRAVEKRAPEIRGVEEASAMPPPAEEIERCDLCGEGLSPAHQHLLDGAERTIVCACPVCMLLFRNGAAGERYRVVPPGARRVDPASFDEFAWQALEVPVDVAYFVRSSQAGRVVGYYPGPGGAVESLLALDAWGQLEERCPDLRTLEPDVQALLVDRTRVVPSAWIVGIDICYRLTGLMRANAEGFTGGDAMRTAVREFLDTLDGAPAAVPI